MKKETSQGLGLINSTTILVGGMIGSAIFSLSGITILNAGPASTLSWTIAAIILFAYGLQTAELSTMYPQSGGIFVFPAKSLGKTKKQGQLWGWISTWAYLFGCIAGAAFSAIYVSIYLGVSLPALSNYQVPIAIASVLFCGLLNTIKINAMGKINTTLTIGLALTMIIFIITAFSSKQWNQTLLKPFFTQGVQGSFGFLGAIPVAMVAFGSIVSVSFMVGEIKNPKKTVPRAMIIAMTIVLSLYLLTILATLGLINSTYLENNPSMSYIPLYAAAFTKLSTTPWLVSLISISAVLALLTTMIVVIALSARALQASAESGILPKALAKTNSKTKMPINSLIIIITTVGIVSAFPNFTNLIVNLGALCNAIVVAIVCITIIAARKKNKDKKNIFKAAGGNALPVITLIIITAAYIPGILSGGWKLWLWTAGYFLIGMIIFLFGTKKQQK